METLSADPPASTIGCQFVDDAIGQAERDHAIVAQLPDPALWIPPPTRLLHPATDDNVGEGDAQRHDLIIGKARPWRFPIVFRDQELHGLEPLLRWGS
jgi:hypothetical protein